MSTNVGWSVGKVAERCGVKISTLHFYEEKGLISSWRKDLDARIAYFEKLRDSLTGCIGCGCLSMKKCPIYNADDKLAKKGPGAVLLESMG